MADNKNPAPCPLRIAMRKAKDAKWTDSDVASFVGHKRQPIRVAVALFQVLASEKSLDVPAEVRAEVRKTLASVWIACDNVNAVLAKVPESIRAPIVESTSGKAGRKAGEGFAD